MAAFYEGGIPYSDLAAMAIDELFAVVECASEISRKREADLKRGK
jgi:hypothetical protein